MSSAEILHAAADARSIGLRLDTSDAIPQLWAWMDEGYMVANWLRDQGTLIVFGAVRRTIEGVTTPAAAFDVVRTVPRVAPAKPRPAGRAGGRF